MSIDQREIWLVDFSPVIGSEIGKVRPALVLSHDRIGRLPLKTLVPLTDWKERYTAYPWMVKIDPSDENGLSKSSAIDCFQIKNLSDRRFVKRIGTVDGEMLRRVHEVVLQTFDPLYAIACR